MAEVDPAEGRRRGKNHHVARLQTIHRLPVAVEADELAVLGYVDLVAALLLQLLEASLETVLKDVGHGDQFDRAAGGGQGVGRRAGAAPAAADQRDPNRIAAGGVGHAGRIELQRQRGARRGGRRLQKLAT